MDVTRRFAELLSMPDDGLPLDQACLLIAAHARPGLDVAAYLEKLDRRAAGLVGRSHDAFVEDLFGPGRYTGNTLAYYEADNSLLDQVIDRQLGIPITLAVAAIELGRRVGTPFVGIGMPGHFLLRVHADSERFYDPFHGPLPLDAEECRRLYHAAAGQGARFDPSYLAPVTNQAIVTRILTNLKVVYQRNSDLGSLSWVMRLRSCIPGVGEAEHDERRRMFSVLN